MTAARSAGKPVLVVIAALLILVGIYSPLLAQAPDPALRGHGGPIRAIAVLDDKTVVTGGFDAAIIVWDVPSGTAKRVLRFHDGAVTALAAAANDPKAFASGGDDGRVVTWTSYADAPRIAAHRHSGPVTALALTIGQGTENSVFHNVWSASWDRSVKVHAALVAGDGTVLEQKAPINGLARLPEGFVSITSDGMVRASRIDWENKAVDGALFISQVERLLRQTQIAAALNGLAVLPAPDNRIVLTAADGRVRVLNADLTPSFELELPDGPLTSVAVSPDGRTIAVAGMRTPVALIDVETREVARRILGPGLPVWALAFSKDGRELFTGGADRALRRWTVATGAAAGEPGGKPADILADAAKEPGARVFRACIACHAIGPGEDNRAGPTLHGIMGRRIGTAAGYDYSAALRQMQIVWTPETIAKLFEVGPAAYTPGTKMPEQRVTDPAERQALVDWLVGVTKP